MLLTPKRAAPGHPRQHNTCPLLHPRRLDSPEYLLLGAKACEVRSVEVGVERFVEADDYVGLGLYAGVPFNGVPEEVVACEESRRVGVEVVLEVGGCVLVKEALFEKFGIHRERCTLGLDRVDTAGGVLVVALGAVGEPGGVVEHGFVVAEEDAGELRVEFVARAASG